MTNTIKHQHVNPLQLTELTVLDSPATINSVEDDDNFPINHHNDDYSHNLSHQIKLEVKVENKNDSQTMIHHQQKINFNNGCVNQPIKKDKHRTTDNNHDRATTTTTTTIDEPNIASRTNTPNTTTPISRDDHNRMFNNLSQQNQKHRRILQTNKLTDLQSDQLKSLIKIIRQGDYNDFIELLESGCFENLLNVFIEGQTALHYSLIYGRSLAWCKQLVLNGANPNLTNFSGWHPIHLAAFNGNIEILDWILKLVVDQHR